MWKRVVAVSMVCLGVVRAWGPASADAADERIAVDQVARGEPLPRGMDATAAFEPNRGQTSRQVDFVAHCSGYVAFLTPGSAATLRTAHGALRMRFEGALESARARALEPLPGRSNYLVGRDTTRWRKGVPHYGRVEYAGVLQGIDVVWRTCGRELEYDVVLAPDAAVEGIRLRFDGADSVALDERGRVVLKMGRESVSMSAPRAFETVGGGRRTVEARTVVEADGTIAFVVGRRTPGATLVIDPALAASTYLGGTGGQAASAVEADSTGIYVTGATSSTDFPTTTGAFQETKGDSSAFLTDAFVTKFDVTGTSVAYSTYLGGNDGDFGMSLFVNADGSLFVGGTTGSSTSNDFPLRNEYPGITRYGFLSELNAAGDDLIVSTRLFEAPIQIGRDDSGNVYLLAHSGRVQRFDAAISQLAWTAAAPVLGGFPAHGFAVTPSGAVWVAGEVQNDGVTTSDAYQTTFVGGSGDGYFLQYDANGDCVYSSFFGGSQNDAISAIALDDSGRVIISGYTTSDDLPMLNARQSTRAGQKDCFVATFDAEGKSLQWSTFHGGSGDDNNPDCGLRTNTRGDICLIGRTASTDFPILNAVQSALVGDVEGFAVVFAEDGSLRSSTYLGGGGSDSIWGGAFVGDTSVAVVGQTFSTDYPTSNAYQSSLQGNGCAVLTLMTEGASPFADEYAASLPDATDGQSYSQALPTLGGTAPFQFTLESGALPTGMTLGNDGMFTGTPSGAGTSTFTAMLEDADGLFAPRTYTLVVNPPPSVTTASLPSWTETVAYPQQQLQGTGGTAPLSWSFGAMPSPPGMTLDSTGLLGGTPSTAGTYDFDVNLQDANGAVGSKTLHLVVNAVPTVSTAALPAWTTTRAYAQTPAAADGTAPLTWSLVSGTLPVDQPIDGATGTLTGTALAPGDYAFTIRATDAAGAFGEKSFVVTINPLPQILDGTLPFAAADRPYSAGLDVSGGTAPFTWELAQGTLLSGVAIDPATGRIAGRPTVAGESTVTVRCTDVAGATAEHEITLSAFPFLDLAKKTSSSSLVYSSSAVDDEVRFLELVAGTKLDLTLKRKGAGQFPLEIHLLDAGGNEVDLGTAKVVKPTSISVKHFIVPATGRYFLIVHPTAPFDAKVRKTVHVAAAPRWKGTVQVDPAGADVQVVVSALPGTKMTFGVRAAKASLAVPTITSVKDAAGNELLVAAELKTGKASATLRMKTALAGGDYMIAIGTRGGSAGDVLWNADMKLPKTYGFTEPDAPSGD